MRKVMTNNGRLLLEAQALSVRTNQKITSDMYGTIRKLHREGKIIAEIIEALGINVTPCALYNHAAKHMKLRLRTGKRKVCHKGDETSFPRADSKNGLVNTLSYRAKVLQSSKN